MSITTGSFYDDDWEIMRSDGFNETHIVSCCTPVYVAVY